MDNKKIGAFIAKNRKKKGLTQEQLGEKLGVSNKTISRWENGNYMPDLSLLQPLSRELGISLNELLTGEEIKEEKRIACSEQNLVDTIDYSAEKIKNEHRKISILIIVAGMFMCFGSFSALSYESSWSQLFSVVGVLFLIAGVFRELGFLSLFKRIWIAVLSFLLIMGIFFIGDYLGVCEDRRPPMYRYMTRTKETESKIIEYCNLFYHVFQINADTPNEYFIIDAHKEYSIDTVPVTPFNRDKSGIENIVQYQNPYVGNNSNTGNLFNSLPLSEHGFVFEIDSENCGLTIDYHFTDWYNNENLYTEKALLYNAVTAFVLIENLESIKFNFSGSAYEITREKIEGNYPNYGNIIADDVIDQNEFNTYVEQKMNDEDFVTEMFGLFEKV